MKEIGPQKKLCLIIFYGGIWPFLDVGLAQRPFQLHQEEWNLVTITRASPKEPFHLQGSSFATAYCIKNILHTMLKFGSQLTRSMVFHNAQRAPEAGRLHKRTTYNDRQIFKPYLTNYRVHSAIDNILTIPAIVIVVFVF